MAKDNKLKESVKEPIKELVKEIVSDTVYKLVKASAKKTVIALRDRLKEEATRRLEEKLKEAAEKRLKQTAKKLGKEFSQDTPQSREYISKIKNGFEKGFQKLLSPPTTGLLKTIIITSVCVLVVGGLIGWRVIDHFIKPLPQPDLIISAITFDIEPVAEEGFPPEEFAPASSYNVTIHYTIENQGDKEAGASTTLLYIDGEPLTDTVDPLPAGGAREGSFPPYPLSEEYFYLDMYTYGHVYLELCADAENAIEESNEENNCATIESTWPELMPPPQPDLVITGITFQMEAVSAEETMPETELPSETYPIPEGLGECPPSYQLTIHYVIENQGGAEAGESTSCLYFCGEVIAEDMVNPLAAGEISEETFSYYPFLREVFYYYFCYAYNDIDIEICTDCGNNVDESNEENNHVTLKFNQP